MMGVRLLIPFLEMVIVAPPVAELIVVLVWHMLVPRTHARHACIAIHADQGWGKLNYIHPDAGVRLESVISYVRSGLISFRFS